MLYLETLLHEKNLLRGRQQTIFQVFNRHMAYDRLDFPSLFYDNSEKNVIDLRANTYYDGSSSGAA